MWDLGWIWDLSARWDRGCFGHISLDWAFFSGLLSVIMIDLILAGDNAVVVAMAVQNLQGKQRKWGIALGAGAAVLLRVICTFFAAQMLKVALLKFVGGALIAWIAVKLLVQGHEDENIKEAGNIRQAVKLIVIADIVMSLDNMLAVAGASKGNMFLLIFGLGFSIPLVVGTSALLSMLMDKYPIIITIGAAVLGKVAGGKRPRRWRRSSHGDRDDIERMRKRRGRNRQGRCPKAQLCVCRQESDLSRHRKTRGTVADMGQGA